MAPAAVFSNVVGNPMLFIAVAPGTNVSDVIVCDDSKLSTSPSNGAGGKLMVSVASVPAGCKYAYSFACGCGGFGNEIVEPLLGELAKIIPCAGVGAIGGVKFPARYVPPMAAPAFPVADISVFGATLYDVKPSHSTMLMTIPEGFTTA